MKVNIGTYSFGGIASYLGLGPTLLDKFKTIASLGFTGVELLPVDLDNDIEDIKKWLKETGLEVVSIHAEPTEEIVKKIAELGGKAVIWAGTPFCNKAEAVEVAHKLDEMAEMAEPYGIKIGYHNHTDEFYVDEMPLEERQKILDGFNAHMNSPEGKKQFEVQCPMGAPESNMNWQDIKDALDEQDFEAFWVVEREGFYDEHDKCIADDARWIKENIH